MKIQSPTRSRSLPLFLYPLGCIQARFTFDIHITPGTLVTLAGFKSMQTRSTRRSQGWFGVRDLDLLPCQVRPFGSFSHQCEFNQETGEVLLFVNGAGTRRYVDYHVNFTLLNPAIATESDDLWAYARIPGDRAQGRVSIIPSVFKTPFKTLLGIPQALESRISTVSSDVCHNMAVECSLGNRLHTCSFDAGMPTEIAGCLVRCNASAAMVGRLVLLRLFGFCVCQGIRSMTQLFSSNMDYIRAECCGLQCLDNCWTRSLEFTRSPLDSHAACAGSTDEVVLTLAHDS